MTTVAPLELSAMRALEQQTHRRRGDPDFMLSLARGLHVLLAFSERKKPATIADIARRTGLDRAVVRRCVHTLECLGMVQSKDRTFELGTNVLSLGHAYFSSLDLVQRAQPLLDALSDTVHTNCALAMLSGSDVVYLVRSQNRRLMRRSLGMGSRLPAHCTSLGRSLLAHLAPEELDDYFAHTERPQATPHTVTDEATLRHILSRARDDGFVVVNEEVELDLLGIAVPVRTPSFPRQLALSVTISPRYIAAHEMPSRYLDSMLKTTEQLRAL
jgi:IclR family pca regulon transcriptional regulator